MVATTPGRSTDALSPSLANAHIRVMLAEAPGGRRRTGYVLVNWTGKAEQAALTLLEPDRTAYIVSSGGREHVFPERVRDGALTIVVPRSVMLVEQA